MSSPHDDNDNDSTPARTPPRRWCGCGILSGIDDEPDDAGSDIEATASVDTQEPSPMYPALNDFGPTDAEASAELQQPLADVGGALEPGAGPMTRE